MPAEDARGLLPTNLLTRINYNTSLRGLLEHSGVRLCSQAQHEWRLVWAKIIEAIRGYGGWQFEELAGIFKPICYKTGKCEFMADVDRFCSIRERVEAHHKLGEPSDKWIDIDLQTELYDRNDAARLSQ